MILGYDFDDTIITDASSLGEFCGLCETRDEFDAWEQKVLQRIPDRYGVRPADSRVHHADLFRDIRDPEAGEDEALGGSRGGGG